MQNARFLLVTYGSQNTFPGTRKVLFIDIDLSSFSVTISSYSYKSCTCWYSHAWCLPESLSARLATLVDNIILKEQVAIRQGKYLCRALLSAKRIHCRLDYNIGGCWHCCYPEGNNIFDIACLELCDYLISIYFPHMIHKYG